MNAEVSSYRDHCMLAEQIRPQRSRKGRAMRELWQGIVILKDLTPWLIPVADFYIGRRLDVAPPTRGLAVNDPSIAKSLYRIATIVNVPISKWL